MPHPTADQLAHWHDTRQPTIYGIVSMFIFLTNASVIIRLVSQWRTGKHFYIEDWAIIAAAFLTDLVGSIFIWSAIRHGAGLHYYRVVEEFGVMAIVAGYRDAWVVAWLLGPWLLATKVSLLCFYKRLFLIQQRWLKWAWWSNMLFAIAWATATTLYYIFQCTPPSYYWERMEVKLGVKRPQQVHGSCSSVSEVAIAVPLMISLVSDIGILLLPMITLAALQMPVRKKIGLTFVLCFGVLACACEVGRIYVEATVDRQLADPTWGVVPFSLVNYAEPCIAIIAACVPFMASQLRWTYDKLVTLSSRRYTSSKGRTASRFEKLKSIKRFDPSKTRNGKPTAQLPDEASREWLRLENEGPTLPKSGHARNGKHAPGQIGVSTEIDIELGDFRNGI